MSRHRDWDIACKVYIGNLGNNASKYELEDAFSKYGPLKNVWVARNPPGFAFVEFEDPRDAEDSVRGMDGTRLCGVRMMKETGKNFDLRKPKSSNSVNSVESFEQSTSESFQQRVRVEMSSGQSRSGGRSNNRRDGGNSRRDRGSYRRR